MLDDLGQPHAAGGGDDERCAREGTERVACHARKRSVPQLVRLTVEGDVEAHQAHELEAFQLPDGCVNLPSD